MSEPLVIAFGGGVNSAAMCVGMQERGVRPDAITFADTGGEKPHTYTFLDTMDKWLVAQGFPAITRVSYGDTYRYKTLEANCLGEKMLPSIAYGYKACSDKWKIQPQDKWIRHWQPAQDCWAAGGQVRKAIGYDALETHRAKIPGDNKFTYWYPLVEWNWDRDDCIKAIERAGLPNPGKSSCFFCPASKRAEILELQRTYPDLAKRAVEMERNAVTTTIVGLGRTWRWGDYLNQDSRQGKLFPEVIDMPCGCYDESKED